MRLNRFPVTWTRCTPPRGECGRAARWPSAPGWWCRRRRACHSSYNWDGMPGLAGPFHLRPAVRWQSTKDPGVNYVPPRPLLGRVGSELQPPPPQPSPQPSNPPFYLSITFPLTLLAFSHSSLFKPSPVSLHTSTNPP